MSVHFDYLSRHFLVLPATTTMRGSCASRRFYHAFYRWNVVDISPRGCRALATTTPRTDNAARLRHAKTRASRHSGPAMRLLDLPTQVQPRKNQVPGQFVLKKPLMEAPVLSSEDKPFDTLAAWEEVVRYRSEAGMLLQIAVPQASMGRMRSVGAGQRLEHLQEKVGARIEVGNTDANSDSSHASVTLSGTFVEVHKARDFLFSHKVASWLMGSPQIESERPSVSLSAWERVVRESDGDYRKVELIIPADLWPITRERVNFKSGARSTGGVHIECPSEHESGAEEGASSVRRQPVLVSGPCNKVELMISRLYHYKGQVPRPARLQETQIQAETPSKSEVNTRAEKSNTAHQSRPYFIVLSIPNGPNGETDASRMVIGTGGSNLKTILDLFAVRCYVSESDVNTIRLEANEFRARKAKAFIQQTVDTACRRQGILPMEVRELDSGPIEGSDGERLTRAERSRISTRLQIAHEAGDIANPTADGEAQQSEFKAAESETSRNASTAGAPRSYFYTKLRIMPGPDGDAGNIARGKVIRARARALGGMKQKFGVNCKILGQDAPHTLKLRGLDKENIRKARNYAQSIIDQACQQAGIPATELQEVDSGMVGLPEDQKQGQLHANRASGTVRSNAAAAQDVDEGHPKAAQKFSMEDLKLALRPLTHPVVLVTSQVLHDLKSTTIDDLLPFCRGVTVSSFNSVTLEPNPVVSFNIRTPSRSWDAISSSGWLTAHILTASPAAAALAHAFTLPYERPDEPFWRARRMGAYIEVRPRNKGLANFAPNIRLSRAVLCSMKAEVDLKKSVQVGDHMIVVAEVKRISFWNADDGTRGCDLALDADGLTYAKRGYRGAGEQIELATIPDAPAETSMQMPAETKTQAPPAQSVAHSIPTDQDAQDPAAAPTAEAQAPASDTSDSRTAERIDIDYFQEIAEDDDDAPSPAATSQPQDDPQPEDVVREEEEHDFGFAAVEDEASSDLDDKDPQLVEDSDAAREEAEPQGPVDGESVVDRSEKETEGDEKSDSQKRSMLDANST